MNYYSTASESYNEYTGEESEVTQPLLPLLSLFVPSETESPSRWMLLYQVIVKLFPDFQVPDPSKDVDKFTKCVFESQEKLHPRTPADIIRLIKMHPDFCSPNFLLWSVAEAIDDPLMFFLAIIDMIEQRDEMWINLATTPGSINLFLNHYLPMVGPSPHSCAATSALIRMLWLIFQEHSDFITMPKKQCKIFWVRLMSTINSSEHSIVVNAFRAACFLLTEVSVILTRQKRQTMAFDLLTATQYPSPVHYQAIELILHIDLPKFRYMTMCKYIIIQGLHNSLDLRYIESILMMPEIKKPFYGLKFLFVTATCNKIWSRAAVETLCEPLKRCQNMEPLLVWGSIFLRRAFLFVAVCKIRKKYKIRQMLVMEMFEKLLTLNVEWMTTVITGCYLGLFSRKRPPMPLCVPETSNIDGCIAMEAEKMAKSSMNMKNYLRAAKIEKEDRMPPIVMPKKSQTPRGPKVVVPKIKNKNAVIQKPHVPANRSKLTRVMSAKRP